MHRAAILGKLLITTVLFGVMLIPGISATNESIMEAIDTLGRRILLYEDHTWQYAQSDVRNLYWGMSKEQVQMVEDVRFLQIDDTSLMAMNANAYDMNGLLVVVFENDQLAGVMYLFDEHYANGDLYIKDYQSMVQHFISLYGKPHEEKIEWIGKETDALGQAFLDGQVLMGTWWETERSNIFCMLGNDDDLFGLAVLFSDIRSENFSF